MSVTILISVIDTDHVPIKYSDIDVAAADLLQEQTVNYTTSVVKAQMYRIGPFQVLLRNTDLAYIVQLCDSKYGGTCTDLTVGYKCRNCPSGQSGEKCQFKKGMYMAKPFFGKSSDYVRDDNKPQIDKFNLKCMLNCFHGSCTEV